MASISGMVESAFKNINSYIIGPTIAAITNTDTETKSDTVTDVNTNKFYKIFNKRIINLPSHYDGITDPGGRVHDSTMLLNAPLVTLVPGIANYKKDIKDSLKDGTSDGNLVNVLEDTDKLGVDRDKIKEWLKANYKSEKAGSKDIRYFGFKSDYIEYFKYVHLLANALNAKMFDDFVYNIDDVIGLNFMSDGLTFYADTSTRYNASVSNSLKESLLSSFSKKMSDASKELGFLTGGTLGGAFTDKGGGETSGKQQSENLKENTGGGVLDTLGSVLTNASDGANMIFPKIWDDSSFSNSVSLGFQLRSPYGDKASIFKFVYVPFIALMAMSFPRQESYTGYLWPFLVQAQCLGYFSIELGMVTDFSFELGPDNMWNQFGLPTAINVSMQISDLYPTMAITKDYDVFRFNSALSGFINNMAGLNFEALNIMPNIKSYIAGKLSYITKIDTLAPKVISNLIVDQLRNIFNP